nr:MAG TPA: hypothetical protein [Caudoviricetes sp.]
MTILSLSFKKVLKTVRKIGFTEEMEFYSTSIFFL